jgi:GNAT superfamily N-acetyltransferase
VVACDLAHRPDDLLDTPKLEVAFLDAATFPDLRSTLPEARDEDVLSLAAMERTRRELAGELVVALEDDELAAIHFIHTPEHQTRLDRVSPQLYSRLRPDEALAEGVFVFPAFRRRGVGPRMLRASASELARRGYQRALAVIDVDNSSSLRAFRAAGFTAESTMRVDCYRLGARMSRYVECDPEALRRYLEATAVSARETRAGQLNEVAATDRADASTTDSSATHSEDDAAVAREAASRVRLGADAASSSLESPRSAMGEPSGDSLHDVWDP